MKYYNCYYAIAHSRRPKPEKEFFWSIKLLHPVRKDKILDVGCNTGEFCYLLKKISGCKVVGIDINKDAIKIAKEKYTSNGINFLVGNAESFKLREKFTAITALQLIEHLPNPFKFLKNSYKHLKKGGRILITTPNNLAIIDKIKCSLVGKTFAYDPTHVQIFTPFSLVKLVRKAGFKIEKITTKGTCLFPGFEKFLNFGWYFPNWKIGSTIFLLAKK